MGGEVFGDVEITGSLRVAGVVVPSTTPPPAGPPTLPVTPIGVDFTAAAGNFYLVDTTAGGVTCTLPLASAAGNGALVGLQQTQSGSGNFVIVTTSGGDTQLGTGYIGITTYPPQSVFYVSDGVSTWCAVANNNMTPNVVDTGGAVRILALLLPEAGVQVNAPMQALFAGETRLNGVVRIGGLGVISPAPLASGSTADDFNPPGLGTCNRMRIDQLGPASIGGIESTSFPSGNANDVVLAIANVSNFPCTLKNGSGGSSVGNTFLLPGFADLVIPTQGVQLIQKDGNSNVWRVF